MRSRRFPALSFSFMGVFGALACSGPPSASLEASPRSGTAPFEVTLDASASAGAESLSFRFDTDGDGEWDTEPDAAAALAHVYVEGGAFFARVEVTDAEGRVTVAALAEPVEVEAALANLTVDADRDGALTGADELSADAWTDARGAVFFANFDDDDGDVRRDHRDEVVDGLADAEDMAKVLVRRSPGLGALHRATLFVEPAAAAARVRLFRDDGDRYPLVHALGQGAVELDVSELADRDVPLLLEGAGSRNGDWDGRVRLRLEVSTDQGVLASDEVMLRVAPIIFPDNTRPAEVLYVMRIGDRRMGPNLAFYDDVTDHLPEGVELYTIDPYDYGADRWAQDSMQTGYQVLPHAAGERTMLTYLLTERMSGYGLEYFLPYELLKQDFGFAYPGGEPSSMNYGGNLEVAPPHEADGVLYPFGRILIGGGDQGLLSGRAHEDRMAADQRAFLEAQETQGAAVELSTEWLAVGHIDEYFLFIPDRTRPERPWRVAVASPTLARQVLMDLEAAGQGDLPVFEGRDSEASISEILADEELMAFSQAAEARIDSEIDKLADALDLGEDDFLYVPVLYEPVVYQGREFAVAYNPGVQNLVVVGQTLFVPDPEGPDVSGVDAWQQVILETLGPTENDIRFVDVFESYHVLLGEAHCGTNVRHAPFEARWWQP